MRPTLLSIAGHDPSSGAGITADLQTFAAHGLFGASAITALTVQSTLGVAAVHPVPPRLLAQTLTHLAADLPPAGIKIGMLGSSHTVSAVAHFLRHHPGPIIVLDPILRSSSGATLFPTEALRHLHDVLLPLIHWITPNWTELAALTGHSIETPAQADAAIHALAARHPHLHILATAGDCDPPTDILRPPSGELHRFPGEHIATTSTHGTGCAFSSALLANLVLGLAPIAAVAAAKLFVTQAIRRAPNVGHGRGPLNLLWPLTAAGIPATPESTP